MLALEIPILLLTGAGTLYGILTKPDLNRVTALVSSTITVLGVVLGISLAVWRTVQASQAATAAEQRRLSDLRTTLATVDLTDLEVIWTFDNVPKEILDILTLGDLMVDTRKLRDDELSRLPAEILATISNGWHLDDTMAPLVVAIASDSFDLKARYEGEAPAIAIKRWQDASNTSEWVDEIGSPIGYTGPTYRVMLPLNLQGNAMLSLGDPRDDVVPPGEKLVWHEEYPSLFEMTNHGFKVDVTRLDKGFKIVWSYDQAALGRAVERSGNTKVSAGLPERFNLAIVHRQLERREYLTKVRSHLGAAPAAPPAKAPPAWNQSSTLEVFVSGLKTPHYAFDVARAGTSAYTPHRGAYDAPVAEYEYTTFHCVLRSLN